MSIINPILPGFNPDPSIIRVDGHYYIATSTFEWFPGVQIHHSTDLVNWELIARPLNRLSQLNMLGVPDSGGVWAPCLSYSEGTFYLVFSNVHSFDGVWKDTPNYLVTTQDIRGDWSDPVFLSASGFDGSLFHDKDGKQYYLSMLVDHRKGKFFGGILLQEFMDEKLIGQPKMIFEGTELGLTEGPHIYQRGDYYYLLTAEGGTEYGHAVTLARSKNIEGPYEVHPQNPLFSARNHPEATFQKLGHADLLPDPENDTWWIVMLAGRPLSPLGRCTLGRESVIEQVQWEADGWPYPVFGNTLIRSEIEAKSEKKPEQPSIIEFNQKELDIRFQSLRIPIEESWCSLGHKPGYLSLFGQQSLTSLHRQSLLAQRVQHFNFEASTLIDFQPDNFQQMAGLVCYYNSYHWYYLHIMGGDNGDRHLQVISCDKYQMEDQVEAIPILNDGNVALKVVWQHSQIQFYYSFDQMDWKAIGPELDASILSDDYVRDEQNRYRPAFTGAFVGMACQDLSGFKKAAHFKYWNYLPLI